jgi:hypothetical protein
MEDIMSRPRRTTNHGPTNPRPRYHCVRLEHINPQPSVVWLCDELMRIAADAERHGLHPVVVAAKPVPRIQVEA